MDEQQNNSQLKCSVSDSYYDPNSFSDRVHQYIASESEEEIRQKLEGVLIPQEEFFAWFEGLVWELTIHSEDLIRKNPAQFTTQEETLMYKLFYQKWNAIGLFLLQNLPQQSALTQKLYKKLLQAIRNAQKPTSRSNWYRRNKGGVYHHIGLSLLYLNQTEKAKSYFILATIEDIMSQSEINQEEYKKTPAYQAMKQLQVFFDEEAETAELKRIISEKRSSRNNPELCNPELIFLEFISSGNHKMHVLQFLLWDNLFLQMLLTEIGKISSTTGAGYYLEILSTYLFFTIGKFEVFSNTISLHAEHDLKVRNLITDDPVLELFGRYFLVECKNWQNKPNSTVLKKFISNLRYSRCDTGILISKNIITGANRKDSAWYVIRAEYHRDNIIVIVITLEDLKQLAQEKITFLGLLKKKYEQIRFDER